MNYKILPPETEGQEYYVVPAFGSGQCWAAVNETQAKQILKFLKNRTPELIKNIQKIP
jgi:hypothetical protein